MERTPVPRLAAEVLQQEGQTGMREVLRGRKVKQAGKGLARCLIYAAHQGIPILLDDGCVDMTTGIVVGEQVRRADGIAARERLRGIQQQGAVPVAAEGGQVDQFEGADVHVNWVGHSKGLMTLFLPGWLCPYGIRERKYSWKRASSVSSGWKEVASR